MIADLQARLYRAVRANDLAEARRLNDLIYPTARVFYADPFIDMHNRMKEALVLLGKLPRAVVRPPLVKISDAEIARIREALVEAGLLGAERSREETRRSRSPLLSARPCAWREGSGVAGRFSKLADEYAPIPPTPRHLRSRRGERAAQGVCFAISPAAAR